MRVRRPLILALLVAAAACASETPARDQWIVWVTTDAPVPAVVDRALFEVLDDAGNLACADCRRVVGTPLDATAWPISFGVISQGAPARLRVRLYSGARVDSAGFPLANAALDRIVTLPPVHGVTDVAIVVPADCMGLASDVAGRRTCSDVSHVLDAEPVGATGRPATTVEPGSWPRAQPHPCNGAPPDGMACVPGAFFVLGDDVNAFDPTDNTIGSFLPSSPQRFASLRPFYLDLDEVDVGAVRALVAAGTIPAPKANTAEAVGCKLGATTSDANDRFAMNCVFEDEAARICEALGKRLPTEAEWELAAGNGAAKTVFPWGESPVDACQNADVGLGIEPGNEGCRFQPGAPVRAAGQPLVANPRDVTTLGIRALAGGLAELVADRAERYDAPCWHPEATFLDSPRCDEPTTSNPAYTVRGASWSDPPALVRTTLRRSFFVAPWVGFRCAKDAF